MFGPPPDRYIRQAKEKSGQSNSSEDKTLMCNNLDTGNNQLPMKIPSKPLSVHRASYNRHIAQLLRDGHEISGECRMLSFMNHTKLTIYA